MRSTTRVSRTLRLLPTTPTLQPQWHPSASTAERRCVVLGVKAVDDTSLRAGRYAKGIAAASHRAVHAVVANEDDDLRSAWNERLPSLPLELIAGDDVTETLASVVQREAHAPDVDQVIVVLSRRDVGTTGPTLRELTRTMREIEGVTPVVLPPWRL